MRKLEKLFLMCCLGFIPPLAGFLAGWWSTCQFLSDWQVMLAALIGLASGTAADAIFLKRWMARAYQTDIKVWMTLFVFYSVCFFGFFMGVPVFNLILAIPAGMYSAYRSANQIQNTAGESKLARGTQIFTTLVFGLICTASAILALRDPTTAANLEGMLRLDFEVTRGMIIGLIMTGGTTLLLLNWWLTGKTIQIIGKSKFTPDR